jgi:hypothetical protein
MEPLGCKLLALDGDAICCGLAEFGAEGLLMMRVHQWSRRDFVGVNAMISIDGFGKDVPIKVICYTDDEVRAFFTPASVVATLTDTPEAAFSG